MPMGGIVNKLGRAAAEYAKQNAGGIAGSIARKVIPEHVRNKISKVADSVIDVLPDSKVKHAISRINTELKKKEEPEMVKQNIALNPSESSIKPSPVGVDIKPQHTSPSQPLIYNDIQRGSRSMGRVGRGGGRH
jgi:hypothetical protein